jgi:hypothetical protein
MTESKDFDYQAARLRNQAAINAQTAYKPVVEENLLKLLIFSDIRGTG